MRRCFGIAGLAVALGMLGAGCGVCTDDSCSCSGSETCTFECPQGNCRQSCSGDATCDASCEGGGCNQGCTGNADCDFTCAGGECNQSCLTTMGDCDASCSGGDCITG